MQSRRVTPVEWVAGSIRSRRSILKGFTAMLMTISQKGVAPIRLDSNEVNFYRKEGYLCLPGLLEREMAESAREEVLDILEQTRAISDRAAANGRGGEKQ